MNKQPESVSNTAAGAAAQDGNLPTAYTRLESRLRAMPSNTIEKLYTISLKAMTIS